MLFNDFNCYKSRTLFISNMFMCVLRLILNTINTIYNILYLMKLDILILSISSNKLQSCYLNFDENFLTILNLNLD